MIFAHGVGSRGDLPLPLWMFTWASAIALVVSFVALGVLWTRPQLARAANGRAVLTGSGDSGGDLADSALIVIQRVGQAAALTLYLIALYSGLFGSNDTSDNLLPVALYVTVWVGAQVVNGLVGDLWRAISPINTLAALAGTAARQAGVVAKEPPARLGQWPAAAGLFIFLFYELVHPSGAAPRTLGILLLVHTLIALALAAMWGAAWVADNEPFGALFSMLASMGVFFARAGGGLGIRPPMTGLARLPVVSGTLAVLLVVLGGTTFDGFSESEAGRSLFGRPQGWSGAVPLTVGLVVSIALISLFYLIGVWWTSRVTNLSTRDAASAFTPSLVPIVFGYAVAHYAQLLVDESQSFVFRLSDPAGLGWDVFGGSDGQIDYNLISVDLIAWMQVLAILFGHVGAVVVAHDRATELFPAGESLRSQFAMLLVMVVYSTLGLWLLVNA
jgi:hypothetical protein